MTRYEQGFMHKCAEYGVDGRLAAKLLQKRAARQLDPDFKKVIRYVTDAVSGRSNFRGIDLPWVWGAENQLQYNLVRKGKLSNKTNLFDWRVAKANVSKERHLLDVIEELGAQQRYRYGKRPWDSFFSEARLDLGTPGRYTPEQVTRNTPARRDIRAALQYIEDRINDANKIID